jgi:protein-S-isoprenylcysteine O-methyltransferase Ste14
MLAQQRRGIKTNRLGRGNKPEKTFMIEVILKAFTFLTGGIQLVSILFERKLPLFITNNTVRYIGLFIALSGAAVFITAIVTMRDSWRAGIDSTQKTEFIHSGIYRYSRNPAFLGFDLLDIGFWLAFSNIINLIFTCCCVVLFHLQILEEEKYLPSIFGEDYLMYKKKTGRYFGTWHKIQGS